MIGFIIFIVLVAAFYFYIYRKWDYKKKFTFKAVMIYLSFGSALLWGWFAITTIADVVENEQDKMLVSRLEAAESSTWSGDYDQLVDTMDLYMDYEQDFEHMWERVYMYTGCRRYQIFHGASQAGLGKAYDEKAAEWKEKLLQVCEQPVYEENIPYAEAFLKQAGLLEE